MKNSISSVKNEINSKSKIDEEKNLKSTNINVLLNRVRIDQKKERTKKILFSTSATLGLLIFGIIIF